ncbi:hypothetical protein [Streptomyces sp. MBT53]|uniref:hypothetical protein n=1 Tax=Streptomyces sp. MBT53 TaxID=1488384 RepID=UPI001913E29A|nr:hypothetical protein [Streptomyces sp. MBT53]MBK6016359.1 hypothetical protein [Streptomyces sp. MBT53]
MTTTPSLPSLVLHGRNATARFESGSDHARWEQDGCIARIPLEAIETVRGLDRTIEIVLTTAQADRPAAVYALRDAAAPAVAAFSAAVRARLPERATDQPRTDGKDLVVTVSGRTGRPLTWRVRAIAAAVAVCAAIDVTVGVLDGWGNAGRGKRFTSRSGKRQVALRIADMTTRTTNDFRPSS